MLDTTNWYQRGEFWYKKPKGRVAHDIKDCVNCGKSFFARRSVTLTQSRFCSVKCSRRGPWNPQWSGDNVSYRGAHSRVVSFRGKASNCSIPNCATGLSIFHWANLTGNIPDPNDYMSMCVFHHHAFDWAKILGMGMEEALDRVEQIPIETQAVRSKERCLL